MGASSTGSFRVSAATNYRVKKAICTIREQPPFFPTFSTPCLPDTHTHRKAHKHLAHYAKTPAAGNTSHRRLAGGRGEKYWWSRAADHGMVGGLDENIGIMSEVYRPILGRG